MNLRYRLGDSNISGPSRHYLPRIRPGAPTARKPVDFKLGNYQVTDVFNSVGLISTPRQHPKVTTATGIRNEKGKLPPILT